MLRLIVRSVVAPHDWSYHRSSGATIVRTTGHRKPRLLIRSAAGCNDRLFVRSVAGLHDWSHIDRWLLPLIARFPTMALDILQSFVIAWPRAEIDRGMRLTAAGDRSKHCRSVAPWSIRNQSYDPEIVRSGVTVALLPHCVYCTQIS